MAEALKYLGTALASGVAGYVLAILKPWYEDRLRRNRDRRANQKKAASRVQNDIAYLVDAITGYLAGRYEDTEKSRLGIDALLTSAHRLDDEGLGEDIDLWAGQASVLLSILSDSSVYKDDSPVEIANWLDKADALQKRSSKHWRDNT